MMIRIVLSFIMILSRIIQTNAAGLRATINNNTRREEQLKLTDDDYIAFYNNEFEMGYLNREGWEKALHSTAINADEDDEILEDDDQFRDALTGGFMSDTALFHHSKTN
jgi:hypothetical protein